MTETLSDRQQPRKVRHAIRNLLVQRIYQIARGWEDVTDSNTPRHDLGFQTALQTGGGKPESMATLSRLDEKIPLDEREVLDDGLLELDAAWLRGQGPHAWRRTILDVDTREASPTALIR